MLFFVAKQHGIEEIFIYFHSFIIVFKSNNLTSLKRYTVCDSTIKSITCVQKHVLVIGDGRGIVVVLLQKSDHYFSYIVNHQESVFVHK